jgi:hypothetical protein
VTLGSCWLFSKKPPDDFIFSHSLLSFLSDLDERGKRGGGWQLVPFAKALRAESEDDLTAASRHRR